LNAASLTESGLHYIARRGIPVISAFRELGQLDQYRDAVERYNAVKARPEDYEMIVKFEQ
jgi:hypothetical protein